MSWQGVSSIAARTLDVTGNTTLVNINANGNVSVGGSNTFTVGSGLTQLGGGLTLTNAAAATSLAGPLQANNTLSVTGNTTLTGKVFLDPGATNIGSNRGIGYSSIGDNNWASYKCLSGSGRSFSGGTANSYGGLTTAIHNRCASAATTGFIWENSSELGLMALNGSNATLTVAGSVINAVGASFYCGDPSGANYTRMHTATGASAGSYFDFLGGAINWRLGSSTRMTLTTAGQLTPLSFSTSGSSTLAATTVSTLGSSGLATLQSLQVNGTTTLNGSASVTGSNTLTVGEGLTSLGGGLQVTGGSVVTSDVQADTGYFDYEVQSARVLTDGLTVTGGLGGTESPLEFVCDAVSRFNKSVTVSGANTLTVGTGLTQLGGSLSMTNAAATANIAGNVTLTGANTLTVGTGLTHLSNLTTTGLATIASANIASANIASANITSTVLNVVSGINYPSTNTKTYASYVAVPGSTTSFSGGVASSYGTVSDKSMRHRVEKLPLGGFVWENSAEEGLMSLNATTGDLNVKGSILSSTGSTVFTNIEVTDKATIQTANIATANISGTLAVTGSSTLQTLNVLGSFNFVPPGTILQYAAASAPPGFLNCTGIQYLTSQYPGLFSVIGYTYGGSGTNFSVPNLAGKTPIMLNGGTFNAMGKVGGSEDTALSKEQVPAHTHTITDLGHSHTATDAGHTHTVPTRNGTGSSNLSNLSPYDTANDITDVTTGTGKASITVADSFTGVTVDNSIAATKNVPTLPPYIVLNFIIKF